MVNLKKKALVIINEQHKLMDDQVRLLNETFGEEEWDIYPIPAEGLTLSQQQELAEELQIWASGAEVIRHPERGIVRKIYPANPPGRTIVFASPIPFLLKEVSLRSFFADETGPIHLYDVTVFHNDHRDKKELPDGRIIQTVAKTGWVLA